MSLSRNQSGGAPGGPAMPQQASDLLLVLIFSLLGLKVLPPLVYHLWVDADPTTGEVDAWSRVIATALVFVAHSLVILACVRAFALRRYGLTWRDLGVGAFEKRHLAIGIGAGLLALPLVGVLTLLVEAFLEGPLENPQIEALAPMATSPGAFLLIAGLGATLVPFAEEIAFRGLFYQWLRWRWGIQIAIVLSALFFAMMHGVAEIVPAITALGIIFAGLLQITRSIWPAVIAHGTFNLAMTTALYFELAGQVEATAALLPLGGP